jgi:hypothetical protein
MIRNFTRLRPTQAVSCWLMLSLKSPELRKENTISKILGQKNWKINRISYFMCVMSWQTWLFRTVTTNYYSSNFHCQMIVFQLIKYDLFASSAYNLCVNFVTRVMIAAIQWEELSTVTKAAHSHAHLSRWSDHIWHIIRRHSAWPSGSALGPSQTYGVLRDLRRSDGRTSASYGGYYGRRTAVRRRRLGVKPLLRQGIDWLQSPPSPQDPSAEGSMLSMW